MERRGFIAAFAGGFGLAAIGQLAEAKPAPVRQPVCPDNMRPQEWAHIQKVYKSGAEAVNAVIGTHADAKTTTPLDIDISAQTAVGKLQALDKAYGQFAEKGWVNADKWADIRKSMHMVEFANCPAPAKPAP